LIGRPVASAISWPNAEVWKGSDTRNPTTIATSASNPDGSRAKSVNDRTSRLRGEPRSHQSARMTPAHGVTQ
jgi:hypothetical protein